MLSTSFSSVEAKSIVTIVFQLLQNGIPSSPKCTGISPVAEYADSTKAGSSLPDYFTVYLLLLNRRPR